MRLCNAFGGLFHANIFGFWSSRNHLVATIGEFWSLIYSKPPNSDHIRDGGG